MTKIIKDYEITKYKSGIIKLEFFLNCDYAEVVMKDTETYIFHGYMQNEEIKIKDFKFDYGFAPVLEEKGIITFFFIPEQTVKEIL